MKTYTKVLPKAAQKVLVHYFHLSIGGKNVPVPYFINEGYDEAYKKTHQYPPDIDRFKKRREKKRVLIGKGSPEEIEKAVYKLAKANKFDVVKATVSQIREFMIEHDLGIDCSGFVVWILNEVYKEKYGKPLWKFLQFKRSFLRNVLIYFRPVENISVITLKNNASEIKDISKIKSGDLIISWCDDHVLLINTVTVDNSDHAISFSYVTATWWYGKENGVRKGFIKITKPKGRLEDQQWLEDVDEKGKNWTREGIKYDGKVMRLHI